MLSEKPLRFIATDVYAEGRGVIVRGRVIQGFVTVGDTIVILPIGDEANVTRVEHTNALASSTSPYGMDHSIKKTSGGNTSSSSYSSSSSSTLTPLRMKTAIAGDNTEIVLTGIDIARIAQGCIICHHHNRVSPSWII